MRPFSWVIEHVRSLAAEHPDELATRAYFSHGQPACIFGHVLGRLGASPTCPDDKTKDPIVVNREGMRVVGGYVGIRLVRWTLLDVMEPSSDELAWCDRVQVRQDNGYSWANSVAHADGLVPA